MVNCMTNTKNKIMKIYKKQSEVEKDIKNGVLEIEGDVTFECSINIEANIKVIAGDIIARDIKARDINAGNINAGDINAWDIKAWDILYYAFCCVYQGIKCLSIKAKRKPSQEPICLEGKSEIKEETTELTLEQIAEKFGKDVSKIKIKK